MSELPTLLCLTGFMGSGKTTVKDLFLEYEDSQFVTIDQMSNNFKPNKKLLIIDGLKDRNQLVKMKQANHFKKIVVVNVECPTELRISRTKKRDHISDLEFHLRDKDGKHELYNVICLRKFNIHNHRTLQETKEQVYYIHDLLTRDPQITQEQIIAKLKLTNER